MPYGRGVLPAGEDEADAALAILEFAAAALKSIVANGALAGSKAPDMIEDEDTTEDAEDGTDEEGRAQSRAQAQRRPRLRWETSLRKDGREIRSEIWSGQVILGSSLFFRSSMSLAFLSRGFRLSLHEPFARLPPQPARRALR